MKQQHESYSPTTVRELSKSVVTFGTARLLLTTQKAIIQYRHDNKQSHRKSQQEQEEEEEQDQQREREEEQKRVQQEVKETARHYETKSTSLTTKLFNTASSSFRSTIFNSNYSMSSTTTETTTIHNLSTIKTIASIMNSNKNRPNTIVIYPTVSPESIVIPIVSCIFGFPILALIVICCLRQRAKMARERDRRRNYDMQDHAVNLVRFSPIHRLSEYYRSSRTVSLQPDRSLSQGFISLELDTVVEERVSDVEHTQTETLTAESPLDVLSYKMINLNNS